MSDKPTMTPQEYGKLPPAVKQRAEEACRGIKRDIAYTIADLTDFKRTGVPTQNEIDKESACRRSEAAKEMPKQR